MTTPEERAEQLRDAKQGKFSLELRGDPSPEFPEEADRPLRLTEIERRFLVEYVESGGEFKASVTVTYGTYSSETRRQAQRCLRKPDSRWYMHRIRMHSDRRIFRTPRDLAIALEEIATSTRQPMKHRLRAFDLLTRVLVGTKVTHDGQVQHNHRVDVRRGITQEQIKNIRAQIIGIDASAIEVEFSEAAQIDAVLADPAEAVGVDDGGE